MMARRQDLADSRQLLRLRQLREAAALREVDQARERHAKAWQQVLDRKEHIALVQRELRELAAWAHGASLPRLPRLAPYAQACRDKLEDELERAQYDLIDEQNTLDQAVAALEQARTAWMRARSRQHAVQELTLDIRRALLLQRERLLEKEA